MSKKTLPRSSNGKSNGSAVAVLDRPEPDEVNEIDAVNTNHIEDLLSVSGTVHNIGQAIINKGKLDNEALGEVLEQALSLSLATLRMCHPLVDEMGKRFRKLSRKKQLDGSYKTIRGCRSFQEWCNKVLHRTEQAVYAMLRQAALEGEKPVKPTVRLLTEGQVVEVAEKVGAQMPPEPKTVDEAISASVTYTVNATKELDTAFRVMVYRKVRKGLGEQIALATK